MLKPKIGLRRLPVTLDEVVTLVLWLMPLAFHGTSLFIRTLSNGAFIYLLGVLLIRKYWAVKREDR